MALVPVRRFVRTCVATAGLSPAMLLLPMMTTPAMIANDFFYFFFARCCLGKICLLPVLQVLCFGFGVFVALSCFCFLFCKCFGIPNSPRSLDLDDRQGLIASSAMQ